MCFGAPSAPPLPPEAPPAPTEADPAVAKAGRDNKRKAALAQGRSSTMLTGGQGLTSPADTTKKTLLGA